MKLITVYVILIHIVSIKKQLKVLGDVLWNIALPNNAYD